MDYRHTDHFRTLCSVVVAVDSVAVAVFDVAAVVAVFDSALAGLGLDPYS